MTAATLLQTGPALIAGPHVVARIADSVMIALRPANHEAAVFGMAAVSADDDAREGAAAAGAVFGGLAEVSDDDLLVAIGTGDERAFAAFMRRHLDRVHAIALRFTGRAADAEDIAQEAFLRVWRSAANWRSGAAAPTTWLHRIAMNLCIDQARRRRLRRFLPFGEAPEPADDAPGPEQQAADREALRHLNGAIARLPERQRAALVLSLTSGHSNAEIAAILGTSTGAVEQALFRARKTLKETFDDEG